MEKAGLPPPSLVCHANDRRLAANLEVHATVVITIGLAILMVRIAPFLAGLILLAGGAMIVAHGGIALRLRLVVMGRRAVLVGALFVAHRVMVAATDHHIRHRR
jgi:hypothetical protein